ncbi:MAG: insulinase family protein, partial [Acetobacteraceae bacterium]|nr:insulinase family protein [Acetobacteraceae bacterium]
ATGGVRARERPMGLTYLAAGVDGPALGSSDLDACRLLNVLLGGLGRTGAPLVQDLCRRRGLAQEFYSEVLSLADGGLFCMVGAFRPGRLAEALEVIGRELGRLARDGPAPAELEQAQRYFHARQVCLGDMPEVACGWLGREVLLLGSCPTLDPPGALSALRPEHIADLARGLFRGRRFCLGLVGPTAPAELPGGWAGSVG